MTGCADGRPTVLTPDSAPSSGQSDVLGDLGTASSEAPPPTSTTSPLAATCDSKTPISQTEASLPEVQGVSTDGTIYGLLFVTHPLPIRNGDELKIVWRITGKGNLAVTYDAPTGRPGVLTFGPTPHAGSTYTRPGDEWGTGFLFDQPGCWHIHLERATVAGDVLLDVANS